MYEFSWLGNAGLPRFSLLRLWKPHRSPSFSGQSRLPQGPLSPSPQLGESQILLWSILFDCLQAISGSSYAHDV